MKYIAGKNLPPKLRITEVLVWWVILDHFNAPAWLYGVMGTLLLLLVVSDVYRMFAHTPVDMFEGKQ